MYRINVKDIIVSVVFMMYGKYKNRMWGNIQQKFSTTKGEEWNSNIAIVIISNNPKNRKLYSVEKLFISNAQKKM